MAIQRQMTTSRPENLGHSKIVYFVVSKFTVFIFKLRHLKHGARLPTNNFKLSKVVEYLRPLNVNSDILRTACKSMS